MLDITRRPSNPILSTAGSFLGYVQLFWGKVCYLGGREAAAYFTGQDRVKNKTAANSTPRVLQGLSMTPSFPLSPQAREYLPRGPPHPRCSGFWLLCKQLSDWECSAAWPCVPCRRSSSASPQQAWPSQDSHPLPPTLPQTLDSRGWEGGQEARSLALCLPWGGSCLQVEACTAAASSQGEWPGCVERWGRGRVQVLGGLQGQAHPAASKASTQFLRISKGSYPQAGRKEPQPQHQSTAQLAPQPKGSLPASFSSFSLSAASALGREWGWERPQTILSKATERPFLNVFNAPKHEQAAKLFFPPWP